jgi:hypothetical protein
MNELSGKVARHRARRSILLALLATAMLLPVTALPADCVPRGAWGAPGPDGLRPLAVAELFGSLARRSVVLLGERHDSAEHHRWQLHVIAALHASRPDMVIGLEMFPRRVQPALDRWVAGELSEAEFLQASDWREVWNTDPQLYLPIFHFARMHGIPMVALNVDRKLTRAVRQKGFDAVPAQEREGISRPAPEARSTSSSCTRLLPSTKRPALRAMPPKAPRPKIRRSGILSRASSSGIVPWRRGSPPRSSASRPRWSSG